jgi:NO-binding membrane sensor protein with MHYT domain
MNVLMCLVVEHDLRLVALAAFVIVSGGWVAVGLVRRASERTGTMRVGWMGLAAIAAGASIWCTHFIAMLAYLVRAPFIFDPSLTILSLLVAVAGSAAGISVALNRAGGLLVPLGGAILARYDRRHALCGHARISRRWLC